MFIKICGMTDTNAVATAVEQGADAIGFVFASSVRRVTPARAAELSAAVPSTVLRVAVTQHPDQALVDEICELFRPDCLQTDIEDLATLSVPSSVRTLPVVRNGTGREVSAGFAPRFLFEGPASGRGETTDWRQAAQLAMRGELILAGGLNAANVGAAIAQVKPFGVDVSSGVEGAPGVKDPHKIIEFIAAARRAFRGLEKAR